MTLKDLRSLSVMLTDQLAEAKVLMCLKSEFGRLPNSFFKDESIRQIDEWFKPDGRMPRVQDAEGTHLHDSYDEESELCNYSGPVDDTALETMASVSEDSDRTPF
jgi:hypothetical protein